MTKTTDYAAACIPENLLASEIITPGETPEQVADALLETHPPEPGLDRDACRDALVERIHELTDDSETVHPRTT